MNQHDDAHDSHIHWLQDIEYRKEYGSESAKLEMAAALADARELMGITQSALAELAGASQAYIAKLEKGDANPTIGNIGRLFSCMWLKPLILKAPMEPLTSLESALIETRSASEANVEFPASILGEPSHPIDYRWRGLGQTVRREEE